jgi:fumarate reductase subunit D
LPAAILDQSKVHETIEALKRRIDERFPGSGLGNICGRLVDVSSQTERRSEEINRPLWALRLLGWTIVAILALTVLVAPFLLPSGFGNAVFTFRTLLELGDPILNEVIILGAAIFFLMTLETRFKRRKALLAIHELRAIAHVIDMHQLTKDPDRLQGQKFIETPESPKVHLTPFLLRRYLDYCSEMLSLTGKLAAVYIQRFNDPVAIAAANDVESLTTGLSRKIWQKISAVHNMSEVRDPGIEKPFVSSLKSDSPGPPGGAAAQLPPAR